MKNKINKLGKWLKESKYTVVLTGAGMSTESGIPDFRSKDGLWGKVDPMKLASVKGLTENYDVFHEFYKIRQESRLAVKPHKGYDILVNWEKYGLINSIVTQNTDDFHLIAGNKNVFRVHGSSNEYRCSKCNNIADKKNFINKLPCDKCGGNLRPSVVLFGEGVPEKNLCDAINEMKKADLVIIIGTSLSVFPVSEFPYITKGKKVYINKEISRSNNFNLKLEGTAGELLQRIDEVL